MKKLLWTSFAALAAALFSMTMVSCGPDEPDPSTGSGTGNGGGGNTQPATVAVSGVSLSKTTLSLTEGGSETLTATVAPDNATNKAVSWKSSDASTATVDNSGKVTAVKAGTATITVTTTDGSKTATCSVTVTTKTVSVTGVTLDQTSLELQVDGTAKLSATVAPSDATNSAVTWNSSDSNVATVDGEGNVTAVKEGEATITVTTADGEKTASCLVKVKQTEEDMIKAALMEIYNAMDGPNWNISGKWDPAVDLKNWPGVTWDPKSKYFQLIFQGFGLKGEFPDCFDRLTYLKNLYIQLEPGVTGTLPPSFAELKNLETLVLNGTSMTSLPDIFNGIPLVSVFIFNNEKMTGPLPESIGGYEGIDDLSISGNAFTGDVPGSWSRLGEKLYIYEKGLSGIIPESFVTSENAAYLINMLTQYMDTNTLTWSVGNYDIPAYWPSHGFKDVVSGKFIPFKEIASKNKATVILRWADWCFHSGYTLPLIVKMYEKYHDAGLEIIAGENRQFPRSLPDYTKSVKERGFDKWYNFCEEDYSERDWTIFEAIKAVPSAIVVDSGGNIIYSDAENINDPTRKRFGYMTSSDLVPFLEDIFGPADETSDYDSKDYSKDGEVMTLQKAKKGKGINIVFMGDGYTDKDMKKNGLYETLMKEAMEEFFAIEPYKTFRDRFNVYAVKVVSKNGRIGEGYETALESKYGEGTQLSGNYDKAFKYARKVSGISSSENLLVNVIVNGTKHAGTAYMSESAMSSVTYTSSYGNVSKAMGPTLRHEAGGHGFAFLDDEYSNSDSTPTKDHIQGRQSLYEKYGWYANIDFTDDPSKIKWSAFLSDSRYADEVGIFVGGSTYGKGVYRPSKTSMMNENVEYFNAPSRWAIYKRIMELSGETASFNKFLEYDAINRGKKQSSASLTRSGGAPLEPTAPPVIIP